MRHACRISPFAHFFFFFNLESGTSTTPYSVPRARNYSIVTWALALFLGPNLFLILSVVLRS